jgi:hypothetical protein
MTEDARQARPGTGSAWARPAGTPRPRDETGSRQVSWLAGRHHPSGLPGARAPVTLLDGWLTAYSCGDSSGLSAWRAAPDSLLARHT